MASDLLVIKDLNISFYTSDGRTQAVKGVSFRIGRGETTGIVGESGCGKSVTALSILNLLPRRICRIESGGIFFNGENLLTKTERDMRAIRGNKISMIFQEPMSSLNPALTIGAQLTEVVRLHRKLDKKTAVEAVTEGLKRVGISSAEKRLSSYPYALSGGQRQRVMITMALLCRPELLIADEPTTALDVTIQAQILDLLKDLKANMNMSILLITHDISVIADMAERVIVIYAGRVVEEGPVKKILKTPKHPYTKGLLLSIPKISSKRERLHVIRGSVLGANEILSGCSFYPRCDHAKNICARISPKFKITGDKWGVRCWMGTEEYGSDSELSSKPI